MTPHPRSAAAPGPGPVCTTWSRIDWPRRERCPFESLGQDGRALVGIPGKEVAPPIVRGGRLIMAKAGRSVPVVKEQGPPHGEPTYTHAFR